MGVVYKGWDHVLNRYVAIKTIRRSLLQGGGGRELLERFRLEARAVGRLNHSNIVAVYDFEEDQEGDPFFVMEFVEGKSLKDFLSRGMHFNLEMSLNIATQLLGALSHSHEHGVVHRDIKPANIILLEDDTVKIADFGIAHTEGSDLTQTGRVPGTPQYSSPEQAAGLRTDARSDLYSTGLVFYELLTGERLITRKNQGGKLHRIAADNLANMDIYASDTLRILKIVVSRSLASAPENRYQNATDFNKALVPLIASTSLPEEARPQGGRNWKWAVLVVALLGAVTLGALQFMPTGPVLDWWYSNTSPPLPPDQQEKVQRYLRTGKAHQLVGRLILPDGSSAYDSYRLALELDPQNNEAREGMESLRLKITSQVEQLLAQGHTEGASSILGRALVLFPDHRQLRDLRDEPGIEL